jgi:hypothetical protein
LQARSVSRIYDLLSLQQNGNLQIREFEKLWAAARGADRILQSAIENLKSSIPYGLV